MCRHPVARIVTVALLLGVANFAYCQAQGAPLHGSAEFRAIRYLQREVPRWHRENQCFSCHNNGDAARALFVARRNGVAGAADNTSDTLAWLTAPERWDTNGPDGPFSDRKLARLQFAAALAAAVEAGLVRDNDSILAAAESLVADQAPTGAWEFVGADELGSPVTYGRPLATVIGLRVLRLAGQDRFAENIAAAELWLLIHQPNSVLNSAAVLWGIADLNGPGADRQRKHCLSLIREGQAMDGGWGAYVDSATEPFDTAIVLCALAELNDRSHASAIRRGREYLRKSQLADGSWPETTRPAARESYAQRLSTTAWATIALLATRRFEEPEQ